MNNKQVILLVQLQAEVDKVEQLKQETLAVIPQVLKEWACVSIKLHQNPNDLTQLMLYETWADKDFLLSDEHKNSPYMTAYFHNIESLLAEPAQWTIWESISTQKGAYSNQNSSFTTD
ncbi:MAG: antibiotic biosynthesis monooxygenase [Pleurocapsa sp. MO_192.B19]|nr:antibiotic biosynthesis monooxygenase [Pleurocapsa sp. MO_192.B19]